VTLKPPPPGAPLRLREVDRSDTDRLELLDRFADRVPELDLDQNAVEWTTLDDGHEELVVNGGGFDGVLAHAEPDPLAQQPN